MKVLGFGGRYYNNYQKVCEVMDVLDKEHCITEVIEGEAPGADTLVKRWGDSKGIPVRGFKADWDKYGHGAGPIRNQQMLDEGAPDLAVGFPGNEGTADMTARCKFEGVKLIEVEDKTYIPLPPTKKLKSAGKPRVEFA